MFDMNQIQQLMGQAQQAQQQMKERLAKMAIQGTAGGSAVQVVVNGNKEVTKITINPTAMEDPEYLADMILAALNSAYAEVDNQVKDSLSGMLGGIDMSQIANLFRQ